MKQAQRNMDILKEAMTRFVDRGGDPGSENYLEMQRDLDVLLEDQIKKMRAARAQQAARDQRVAAVP